MRHAVIAGFARSPFTLAGKGALARTRPDDLAAAVVSALVERSGIAPAAIEDVIVGCAFPEGEQGLNLARTVTMLAGLPYTAAAATLNRYCGSSMSAVHLAAGAIALGAGDVFVCAGVESMSRVPMLGFNPMPHPGLARTLPGAYHSMGQTAETLARQHGITRAEQDAFACFSHQKAAKAQAEGRFAAELVPIRAGETAVAVDGGIRPDTNVERLVELKPAFLAEGSVTAGTSSPLTDGAAAVLVVAEDYAIAHDLPMLARIRSVAVAGCSPEVMGIGPVPATRKALARAGLTLDRIDVIELNEAFAAQALAVIRELQIDMFRLNRDGGALALGHPLGASGARILGKAAAVLKEEGKQFALATMCIGGGQGIATVLEAVG